MMTPVSWCDVPEDLWWPLYKSHDAAILDYMQEHHTCPYGNWGSRVNACERIALPGSNYCEIHGGEDNEW